MHDIVEKVIVTVIAGLIVGFMKDLALFIVFLASRFIASSDDRHLMKETWKADIMAEQSDIRRLANALWILASSPTIRYEMKGSSFGTGLFDDFQYFCVYFVDNGFESLYVILNIQFLYFGGALIAAGQLNYCILMAYPFTDMINQYVGWTGKFLTFNAIGLKWLTILPTPTTERQQG